MTWGDLERNGLPKNTTAVVSLAGQNILDRKRKWNSGFQQTVRYKQKLFYFLYSMLIFLILELAG